MNEEPEEVTIEEAKVPPDSPDVENAGEPEEVFLGDDEPAGGDPMQDKLLRLMADYENFRRRSAKERAQERQRGRRDAAEKLLPVFDSLAAALITLKPDDPGRRGLEAVHQQLVDAFGQLGIEKIPTKGQVFDPELMEAVAQLPHPEAPEGTVVDETRPGFRDSVGLLRAAQVVVSGG